MSQPQQGREQGTQVYVAGILPGRRGFHSVFVCFFFLYLFFTLLC